ncbi:glycoside hydrolase family 15 protein [Steroidobacter cummioxidans]|uniref:glycoside hydrolase family 15 protein n=1 Tax=Steroidobacter cummioxidans TaxID=1803913 RepID=UPI000E316396|nr:glycoside hydrolase family 15 protein [Steroidobacter cummioxidans]
MTSRIEDYALIGDLQTAALVGRNGSIDWLCWPRFDSDACFAALLGDSGQGHWSLAPKDASAQVRRRYRDDTLILETRFEVSSGAVVIVDFMPPRGRSSDIIRVVSGERGVVEMCTELIIRFGYGATIPWVTRIGEGIWQAAAGPDMVILRTSAPMRGENLKSVADFTIHAGETVQFILTYAPSHLAVPRAPDVPRALSETEQFWREWIAKGNQSACRPLAVRRSLITLRALTHSPTGGIIAAPTTSLPEEMGGTRNWDYRLCWLRDATLTLLAFMNAGYFEEADAWRAWLLRAIAGNADQLQVMYGVAGERRLTEWEVTWLPGYEGSRPVRVGNDAHAQMQLDVFGEVMDALHQGRCGGLATHEAGWALQRELLSHLASVWQEPDYGIWEMRSKPRHFTYSKIMSWVAFDRGIKDAERYSLNGPLDQWRALRAQIHKEVCERAFNSARNTFVQSYGSTQPDASLLLIPQLGFLPATDARVLGTIAAIESSLLHNGFVHRYDTAATDDGLPPGEGTFIACSFWLADAYVMTGRIEQARALFERLLTLSNDVGLLAEEYDPATKRMLGNFPQGFSHLSLIGTALNLEHASKPAEQRSGASIGVTH